MINLTDEWWKLKCKQNFACEKKLIEGVVFEAGVCLRPPKEKREVMFGTATIAIMLFEFIFFQFMI